MVSLKNAELFDAQSLLFLGMPGDLAFGGEHLFKELPDLSAQNFVGNDAHCHDHRRERAYPSHLVEDMIAN